MLCHFFFLSPSTLSQTFFSFVLFCFLSEIETSSVSQLEAKRLLCPLNLDRAKRFRIRKTTTLKIDGRSVVTERERLLARIRCFARLALGVFGVYTHVRDEGPRVSTILPG